MDAGLSQIEHVDDAQVNAAYVRLVVVDQPDALFIVGRIDVDFFREFTSHAFAVDIAWCGVGVVLRNMPADADASLGVQPAFALSRTARVLEQVRLAIRSRVAEQTVRELLLEAGILLYVAAATIADVGRV